LVITRTQELKKRSPAHIFHTFQVVGSEPELIFEKGKGIILTDTDGKEYIDMGSTFLCTNLGYGRKEFIDVACEQMSKLSFMASIFHYSNIPAIEYAEALTKFTPKNINHFFFCNSGSEANDTILRIIRAYWRFQGKPNKLKIICLMEGYHGQTESLRGLLGDWDMRASFGPEPPGVVRIPNYNCYRCPLNLKYPDCGIACAKLLDRVIEEEGEDSVATFIAEPVQGVGGVITPPPEYWPIVREICTKHHVLLIDDEVMTGFCRTGKNFAVDNWNVEPDFITMAKGIAGAYFPIGVVGIGDEVYAPLATQSLWHGFTTSGHPVGCAIGKTAIDIYIKENICEHVTKMGNHIRERLEKEFLPLPNVGQVGGLGLFQAIEIVADKETKRRFPTEMNVMSEVVRQQCLGKGLLPLVYSARRHDRMVVAPPLIITEAEADKALDILYPILAGLKDLKVK